MTTSIFPIHVHFSGVRDVMDIPLPEEVVKELHSFEATITAKRVSNGMNYSIDVGLYDARNIPIKARAHSASSFLSPSIILGMMPRARAYAKRVK